MSTHHYAILIRAPEVGLNVLSRGNWVLMDISDDFSKSSSKFRWAQTYLSDKKDSQVAVLSIDKTNLEDIRAIGLFRTRRAPSLTHVVKAEKDIQEIFWNKARKVANPELYRRPAPQPEKRSIFASVMGM